MSFEWDDEKLALLKRRWAERATDRKITAETVAAELGTTRNAVLGKVHRLGMSSPGQRGNTKTRRHVVRMTMTGAPVERPPRTDTKERPWREGVDVVGPLARAETEDMTPYEAPEPGPDTPSPADGVDLVDLKSRSCRWPKGDPTKEGFKFCGRTTIREGKPYCEEHHAESFIQPKGRVR